eukprot:m.487871 g.487871  ORF g.487871 m.487871 type:complete len:631 (+) comp21758_c0_seq2:81-1973(+)
MLAHLYLAVTFTHIVAVSTLPTTLINSGTTYYVSTTGSDKNRGTTPETPLKTLHRAADVVASGDSVNIAAGDYFLDNSLALDSRHSNTKWIGTMDTTTGASTVVSGGRVVTGWRQSRVVQGSSGENITIVSASVAHLGAGVQHRHLYVNAVRATRVRLPDSIAQELFDGATLTDDGYVLKGTTIGHEAGMFPLASDAEFVFPQSTSPWTEPRCAVASANVTHVLMKQPCWINLKDKACGQGVHGVPVGRGGYIENVDATYLSEGGEWALDSSALVVHYALRQGEAASTMRAVMPVLETLVNFSGASSIAFTNISFQHGTWRRPGASDGYVEQQTGCCAVGTNPLDHNCDTDAYWSVKSPGNVAVVGSKDISFALCEFAHLGGVGLDMTDVQDSIVDSCYFHDISGAAVQIGLFFEPTHITDVNNTVRNTVVNKAGAEYSGAAGINLGYTRNCTIIGNDVSNMTYVPISVGWGWSRHECWNCTHAGNNTIAYNRAHHYKQTLNDGGGIYMLGPQNNSVIHDNWVFDQGTASSGALYPDEGSAYSTWFHNVVTDIGRSEWLHLWTGSIHNVVVENNFVDTSTFLNHGTNCPMINNTVFAAGKPPTEAVAIMQASGVQRSNPWKPADPAYAAP